MLGLLGSRWFKSRAVASPLAKSAGSATLLIFLPALLGLLPWHWRWLHAVPIEGLLGRMLADLLIHYLNLLGAYIVCASMIAAAVYLTTAFSLAGARLWMETRFAFAFAAWDRWVDWHQSRNQARRQRDLEKLRASQAVIN